MINCFNDFIGRLKQRLTQDQQSVLRPDVKTPFISHEDIVKRLTPYHVSYDPSPTPEDIEKGDCYYFLPFLPFETIRVSRLKDEY